jgi:ABC-2 type transport system permease protein
MMGIVDRTVMWLTFRQLFVRRRLIAAALFSLVPVVIALIRRGSRPDVDPQQVQFLLMLYREIVVGTLLPLAAVVFGTTAFGGEFEEGTIVYLLVKPLPRWKVVASKFAVATLSTTLVMIPALVLPWLVLGGTAVPSQVPLAYAAGIGLGALFYCAIFIVLGLSSKRALVLGLLYIVVLEFVMSRNVAGVKSFSVREYVLTVVGKLGSGQPGIVAGTVTMETVWTMGAIILVGSLALAVYRLRRFELAERL